MPCDQLTWQYDLLRGKLHYMLKELSLSRPLVTTW